MPSDQTQAIEYGEPLERGTFDFTAGGAAAPIKRVPNAFLTKVLSRLQKGRIIVQTPSTVAMSCSVSVAAWASDIPAASRTAT